MRDAKVNTTKQSRATPDPSALLTKQLKGVST